MARNFVFNTVPRIYYSRSVQDLSHGHLFTADVGDLIPFYCQEVYAGDSISGENVSVIRATVPFIRPVFGNLFADTMFFFVPTRLLVNDVGRLFGENTKGAWAPETTPTAPIVFIGSPRSSDAGSYGVAPGSVLNYLGVPYFDQSQASQVSKTAVVSAFPVRAFALVYNDWFRDENLIPPMNINKTWGSLSSFVETSNSNAWSPTNYTGMCPKVSKTHDYFTSCLPSPQKGETPQIPVSLDLGYLPVVPREGQGSVAYNGDIPMKMNVAGGAPGSAVYNVGFDTSLSTAFTFTLNKPSPVITPVSGKSLNPSNLWADGQDLSSGGTLTVGDLRFGTAVQRVLERDARGGTRFIEYLRSAFGVDPGDARLDRPEYLGGSRNPISIQQVAQTTGSSAENNSLAELGAFSLSSGRARFAKGFVEPGYIIGTMCIRYYHTYSQGLERFWTRFSRFDFYDPAFAHLSEQPVYQSEIYAQVDGSVINIPALEAYVGSENPAFVGDRPIFGYNEPWVDLRNRQNRVSGAFVQPDQGLDIWGFWDSYTNAPSLTQSFIEETPDYVDRCLSAPHTTIPNFMIDTYTKVKAVRRIPSRGVPGLVDHLGNQ